MGDMQCAAQRAQEVGEEKNRAVRAALNAELRCVHPATRVTALTPDANTAGLRPY